MGKKLIVAIYLLFLIVNLVTAGEVPPIATTVNEVLENPQKFDGKTVYLNALVISKHEVIAISDPHDKRQRMWLSYPGGMPDISLTIGNKTPQIERPAVTLRKDDKFQKFQEMLNAEMYPRTDGSMCIGCNRYEITAEMTGRIDVAPENYGFGHLNSYKVRLMLESIDDFQAKDIASEYDLNLYSTSPVRFPRGYLTGKILDQKGKPVGDISVTALSTEDVALAWKYNFSYTDKEGCFEISVRPGKYILGINKTGHDIPPSSKLPYKAFYYPNVTNEQFAKIFDISDRQRIEVLVQVHSDLIKRTIPVKVLWPNKQVVADANVWIEEESNPGVVVGESVSHTDPEGRFDLIGFEGINYFAHADIYLESDSLQYCAEKQLIENSESTNAPIELILEHSGEKCREDD
jgi:hypothetical protein